MFEVYLARRFHQLKISPGLAISLSALTILGLVYFAWPVYRAFLPLQIDFNEPWNAYHADMLRAGEPLYPSDDFVTNNYPPLSFYAINALSEITGVDALYVGRMLSVAAVVAITLSVWACASNLGASALAAALGALWWLASMSRWYAGYVGMDDPHLVALAIMAWSLCYALRNPTIKQAGVAIVCMALAGFYKHDLFATPAIILCWWTMRDWRAGLRLTLLGLGTVAVGLAICGAVYGDVFFHSLFLPRRYEITRLGNIGRLQFVAPAMIIVAAWAAYSWQNLRARFVSLYMAIGLFSYLGQGLADGVADNAAFELVFAIAIGIGCAFDDLTAIPALRRLGLEASRILVVGILIGRLLISLKVSPYLVLISSEFRASLSDRAHVMKAEAIRISKIKGEVVCDIALACRFAGKLFVFDPFMVGQYAATGRISQSEISARLSAREIRFEAIDPRARMTGL